ncbi:MAG: hypothetical protein K2Q18_10335, partial [Bdellovibrionales bacterium]|nr:hypothetical protein [Bdellovibrionales bacterium]
MIQTTFFIMLFSVTSFAQDFCKLEEKNAQIKIEMKEDIPEYFFKAIMPKDLFDTRNEATVILAKKGNVLLNLKTGEIKKIPGPFDAVPSVDGNIITVPGNPESGNRFSIYSREDLKVPIFQDSGQGALVGVYQSVGILGQSNFKNIDRTVYRVITDTITTAPRSPEDMKALMAAYQQAATAHVAAKAAALKA